VKQYTNEIQTAKLIELGLEKPKNERWVLDVANESSPRIQNIVKLQDYSIGELIEMLPREYDGELLEISAVTLSYTKWMVRYPYGIIVYKNELIDALYDMIIRLKEEGEI
jgi:hypothetical protein